MGVPQRLQKCFTCGYHRRPMVAFNVSLFPSIHAHSLSPSASISVVLE